LRRHEGSDQSNGKIGIAGKYSQDSSNRALANCCRLIETNIDVGLSWFLSAESIAPSVFVRTLAWLRAHALPFARRSLRWLRPR
jgi:hypothetical protein